MSRVKFIESYWDIFPTKKDFIAYDADVLMNRMLMMYAVRDCGNVEILHPFQIANVIKDKRAVVKYAQAAVDFVNGLSESDWKSVCEGLEIKGKDNHV